MGNMICGMPSQPVIVHFAVPNLSAQLELLTNAKPLHISYPLQVAQGMPSLYLQPCTPIQLFVVTLLIGRHHTRAHHVMHFKFEDSYDIEYCLNLTQCIELCGWCCTFDIDVVKLHSCYDVQHNSLQVLGIYTLTYLWLINIVQSCTS